MSRLTELLRQLHQKDPELAADLGAEVNVLLRRRAFGLNFERHTPETVELPGRPVRVGDKVRFLPQRGESSKGADRRLWRVLATRRTDSGRLASLASLDARDRTSATVTRASDDLVVVAEFRDPIYPGLRSTGRVMRGGDKPFHTVINAENFHALQALLYTHEGAIDAIYIDPPYNTRDRDWKYNNDYVDSDDQYKHSKWLAFMERRLGLAKKLLNPDCSVLIVTIDDKEVHRLALLLQQVFSGQTVQMITSVINPRGKYRDGEFARCDEYLFFVTFGSARVIGEPDQDFSEGAAVSWRTLRRSDITSARGTSKGGTSQFYPLYIEDETRRLSHVGDPMPHGLDRRTVPERRGCTAVFPVREDGTEMNWGLTPGSLHELLAKGYVRVGRHTPDRPQAYEVSYLTSGRVEDIESGRAKVNEYDETGAVIAKYVTHKMKMPVSTWVRPSHNAETGGTAMIKALLGRKDFPYPKSLYAVEDALRLFIADRPTAVVLDFFSGSGTTAHAVMRLNKGDGGRRQCISVTNNEVSADEQSLLNKAGLRPGDEEWEQHGICRNITIPRIRAAVTGRTPTGEPAKGDYKFNNVFPISEGLAENVEFFDLTYEAPRAVAHNRSFSSVAALLWLRAGSRGPRIETATDSFAIADTYGVLFDLDESAGFVEGIIKAEEVALAFIVTDDEHRYQMVCAELPQRVESVRLYESFLTNFTINTGRE